MNTENVKKINSAGGMMLCLFAGLFVTIKMLWNVTSQVLMVHLTA